jgi:3-oxoadipate enol-lactonase
MDLDAHGLRVHCEVSGRRDGPPLLCLHSLATDGDLWHRQLAAFEENFTVIRPDFRGHGGTEATPPPYTLEQLRDDTVAVLDALGVDRVSVVGVSLGAIVAIGMALDASDRVERILVADCRSDAPPAYVAMWDSAIASVRADGLGPFVESSLERWFAPAFRAAQPQIVERVRERSSRTPIDGMIGGARAVQQLAYRARLREIAVPVQFVVGSEDPAAPPAVMAEMAELAGGAPLTVLDGAGHLTPLETGDAFTAVALDFVAAR